jgi:hypothetical protein
MSDTTAITMLLFGLVALVFELLGQGYYSSIKVGSGESKVPKWFGHLWFIGFAGIIFYMSIHHFASGR